MKRIKRTIINILLIFTFFSNLSSVRILANEMMPAHASGMRNDFPIIKMLTIKKINNSNTVDLKRLPSVKFIGIDFNDISSINKVYVTKLYAAKYLPIYNNF